MEERVRLTCAQLFLTIIKSSRASLNINISSSVDVKVIVKCDGRTIIIISMSVILVDIIIFDEPDLRE